jgi:hypothetical protein
LAIALDIVCDRLAMKKSIYDKLEQLAERLTELDGLLGSENATRDMDSYRKLTREHAEITPLWLPCSMLTVLPAPTFQPQARC